MIDILYEHHLMPNPALPFIIHTDFYSKRESGIANWHENTEFLYCVHGEGCVNCDTVDIHMKKGDTVIINARQLHTVSTDTEVRYRCLIIDNSFFKDNGINIENIRFTQSISDVRAGELIEKAVALFEGTRNDFSIADIRHAVLEFIIYVCKNHSLKCKTEMKKVSKSYAAVLDAVEYINENFSQKLTLDELSSRAGFSRYYFARIFKENTGFTVIEHINAIRCDNAAFLLRESELAISEISFRCGFDSPSYFAKAFAGIHGVLPSEYRKKYSRI